MDFIKKHNIFKKKDINVEQKKIKKQLFIIIGIILIICIIFFSGISMGKVMSNTNIQNDTKIAKPILEVEKDSEIIITEDCKQGEYSFVVKNYNSSEEISQVDLKYYIEILENNLDDFIEYHLYKENEELILTDNKTEEMSFQKDMKEEETYTLKVIYNSDQNTMEDIIEDIQIKVHSEQLKV